MIKINNISILKYIMKNKLLLPFIILLLFISIPYFILPFENSDEVIEGFKSGKGGRKSGGRKSGGRKSGGRRSGGRRSGGNHPKFYRRSSYRRYPYYFGRYGDYNDYVYPYYSTYDILSIPYMWGDPYNYNSNYNWFDFRNCPPGCVANSKSPNGFSCVGNDSGVSCLSDYDCSGCNFPSLTYY